MTNIDFIAWTGSALLLVALVLTIKTRRWYGFAIGLVGESLWTYVAWATDQDHLFLTCVAFCFGYVWGVYEWRTNRNP
jgi:nicotinamide riboside transporter PnuC